MLPTIRREARRLLKPLVPSGLIEARRRRLQLRAEPINRDIASRYERMWGSMPRDLLPGIDVSIAAPVRSVLDGSLRRFEDVCFSPDGGRLALAGFSRGRIVVLSVRIEPHDGSWRLVVDDYTVLVSPVFRYPHGAAFLDGNTLVVANRGGKVAVVPVPEPTGGEVAVRPLATFGGGLVRRRFAPGSVAVVTHPAGREVLVVDNDSDAVLAFRLDGDGLSQARRRNDAVRQGLQVPDGIAVSSDAAWTLVSNHGSGVIRTYRGIGPDARPEGTLSGFACPHGVRFVAEGRRVLAVDAAGPWLHVFSSEDGSWEGERSPVGSVRIMDEATFLRGREAPGEGGAKGIAVDPGERIVVTTCAEQPLAAFDLRAVLAAAGG